MARQERQWRDRGTLDRQCVALPPVSAASSGVPALLRCRHRRLSMSPFRAVPSWFSAVRSRFRGAARWFRWAPSWFRGAPSWFRGRQPPCCRPRLHCCLTWPQRGGMPRAARAGRLSSRSARRNEDCCPGLCRWPGSHAAVLSGHPLHPHGVRFCRYGWTSTARSIT